MVICFFFTLYLIASMELQEDVSAIWSLKKTVDCFVVKILMIRAHFSHKK